MKLLVDMNLSVDWLPLLAARGWQAEHWSHIGPGNAPDSELLIWARMHGYTVVTEDLDFSQLLFATQASGPSVVLLRVDNEFDHDSCEHVCAAIAQAAAGPHLWRTINHFRSSCPFAPPSHHFRGINSRAQARDSGPVPNAMGLSGIQ